MECPLSVSTLLFIQAKQPVFSFRNLKTAELTREFRW